METVKNSQPQVEVVKEKGLSTKPLLERIASTGERLAAVLVAFALWRLGTAPPAVVPVEPSAISRVAVAGDARAAAESTAGHHHRSHHGGVVGMVGDRHLEALALSSGRILVYLSGFGREPLPHDRLTGTATVYRDDDAMAAHGQGDLMREAMRAFAGLLAERPEITRMTPLAAKGLDL